MPLNPIGAAKPAGRGIALAASAIALTAASLALQVPTAPAATTRRPVLFQQFSSCPKLMAALRATALPYVSPYGLGGGYYFPGPVIRPANGTVTPNTRKTKAAAPVPIDNSGPVILESAAPMPASAPATTAAAAAAPAAGAAVARSAAPQATAASEAAAANSSATNVQELGVDEGDTVENDGRYLFAIVNGAIRIVDTANGKAIASLGQANGAEQLLLDGNRLAVIRSEYNEGPETVVTLWDVTDRATPRRLSESHLEGSAVSVRSVGGRARIVLNTQFGQRLRFVQPGGPNQADVDAALAANKRIVNTSTVEQWLPRRYTVRPDGTSTPVGVALDCREIGKPVRPSGLGFTWVATLDLNVPNPKEGARGSGGVIAEGQIVYSSKQNLFVATTNQVLFGGFNPAVVRRPTPAQPLTTDIHTFDLSAPDGATYRASGSVNGRLLNQFSMSEYDGNLRVAITMDRAGFGTQQQNGVVVFRPNGRTLDQIGRIEGLGLNEQIYAVRFVGDLGYVVTFRRTDPLYVLDLRNPTRPTLLGELKIPGYSSYLHPIGPGRLLGIGQDATPEGRVLGTQLSVFDVSDPTNPRQLSTLKIGGNSPAEYDHRAFLWWAKTSTVVVPANTYDNRSGFTGVVVAQVTDTAITERGRIRHEGVNEYQTFEPVPLPAPAASASAAIPPITTIPGRTVPARPITVKADEPIVRSLIIDGNLVTVGPSAVKSSNLDSLAPLWFTVRPA